MIGETLLSHQLSLQALLSSKATLLILDTLSWNFLKIRLFKKPHWIIFHPYLTLSRDLCLRRWRLCLLNWETNISLISSRRTGRGYHLEACLGDSKWRAWSGKTWGHHGSHHGCHRRAHNEWRHWAHVGTWDHVGGSSSREEGGSRDEGIHPELREREAGCIPVQMTRLIRWAQIQIPKAKSIFILLIQLKRFYYTKQSPNSICLDPKK